MARVTAQERLELATALYAVVEQLWWVRFGERSVEK